jgi:hypothetical protein
MTATANKPATPKRSGNGPILKVGPFVGGISVNLWENQVDTDNGTAAIRSVTISPRRYLDKRTGEWKDAKSYRPVDIPAIMLGLEKVHEYNLTHPIPGDPSEDDRMSGPPDNSDEPPY